jgi:hypothetical protein
MVLKEVSNEVKQSVINVLQLINKKKFEKLIAILNGSDYIVHKEIGCSIRFDFPLEDEKLNERKAAAVLHSLEQFHFYFSLSPTDFYFEANIQELYGDGDYYSAKFHQNKFNEPTKEGDLSEYLAYLKLALQIKGVSKMIDTTVSKPKLVRQESFQDYLARGHFVEMYDEELNINSFSDYLLLKGKLIGRRDKNEPIDLRVTFYDRYFDKVEECNLESEIVFTLNRGNPHELLEIDCNLPQYRAEQYQEISGVFNYIRSITEKQIMLKKVVRTKVKE